jgi:hypothetical protein
MSRALLFLAVLLASVAFAQEKTSSPNPVDQLIPWLLDEDRQLRSIPFNEVIFDTTGKKVIAINRENENDQRVLRQISAPLMKSLGA